MLNKILNQVNKSKTCYPIELKIQLTNGEKIRYFPPIKLDYETIKKHYDKIDFIKLDDRLTAVLS